MIQILLSVLFSQWTLILCIGLYGANKWLTANHDCFKKKNIAYDPPNLFFGSFKGMVMRREAMFDMYKRLYMKYKDCKYFGMFEMRKPVLMINDRQIIKQITIKDFDHFVNHRIIFDAEDEPLFGNSLVALRDQKWKDMRATLSPAFTGSKMRLMFQFINECGRTVTRYLKSEVKDNGEVEINLKDLFTRFTNDVIAACAFGLEINSFTDKDNEFYQMSHRATNFTGLLAIKMFLFSNFRRIMKMLKIRLLDKKFVDYFHNIVMDTMHHRATREIVRPDMIHLLMEARKGILRANDLGTIDTTDGFAAVQESFTFPVRKEIAFNWSDSDLVAQCFLFFTAGLESSAILMCFCAHELMENPDVQERLIDEIDKAREELDDRPLTYEVIQNMKYLDMVVSETLRKWPSAIVTDRVCTKPYIIGNKDEEHVKLNPGDTITISIVGLHYDPDLYPDPDKFDPERFSDDNKHRIDQSTYIPFGIGPRNCIGSRFALMEAKAIIVHLLTEFTFEPSPKTSSPLVLDKTSFTLAVEGGFWINFKSRN